MSLPRIRANADNTGIIYITHDGNEIEIPISAFNPKITDINDPNYHNYNETSNIPGSQYIHDKSIIDRNFREEPAPTFGLWGADKPVNTGDESYAFPVGTVTHYLATGPNGESIVVNVTKNSHLLAPGIVVRELYYDDAGFAYIDETGVGTGDYKRLNLFLADGLWQENANRIGRESIYEDTVGEKAPPSDQLPFTPPIPGHKPTPPWLQDVENRTNSARDEASPLVLDLDGDGVELVAVDGPGAVYWDIDTDGLAEKSAWVAGGDGLLVYDRNGDGRINNHSELFGTKDLDGFMALAPFDSNDDNVININDVQFGELKVWVDANSDGITQDGELHTLSDLGITSISLTATSVNYQIAGNTITHEANFTINGVNRKIVDAWFAYDDVNTVYSDPYTLDVRTLFMPTVRGYGDLPDLHIAMSKDNGAGGLLEMVQTIALASAAQLLNPTFDLEDKIRSILFHWAGVEDIAPNSRGSYIDARELAFLEVLTAEPYIQRGAYSNPGSEAAESLKTAFREAFDNIATNIIVQTDAASVLFSQQGTYNPLTDTLEGTFVIDFASLQSLITANAATGNNLLEFWRNVLRTFEITVGLDNLAPAEDAQLHAMIANSDPAHLLNYDKVFIDLYGNIGLTLNGTNGDDILIGANGNDTLNTDNGNDKIYGRLGNDTINGGAGDDELYGEGGNDYLYGSTGNDILDGGEGDDFLEGRQDNDTYIYTSGLDTILDSGGIDKIVFAPGYTLAQTQILRSTNNANDLEIYLNGVLSVRIEDFFLSSRKVESAEYSNGDRIDLTALDGEVRGDNNDNILNGNDSPFFSQDKIYGFGGNDTIYGGLGDDFLYGASGNDIYLLSPGVDTIEDSSGTDKLVFSAGITLSDLSYVWHADESMDLYIKGTLTVIIKNQFYSGDSIDFFEFSNGEIIDVKTIVFPQYGTNAGETIYPVRYGGSINNIIYGYDGNDYIYGHFGDDTLIGGDGDDTLNGEENNDTLVGGKGIDTLQGEENDDILNGGLGNDFLYGGSGADTYVFSYGDGNDLIVETDYSQDTNDRIVFATGITQSQISFERLNNDDLMILINNGLGGSIRINYQFDTTYDNAIVEKLQFADGSIIDLTTRNYTFNGTNGNDTLWGVPNAGGGINDTINGLDGNDTIYGYLGLDILNGGDGNDTLYGSDGSSLDDNDTTANVLNGGRGNDILNGAYGNEILDGGTGNDKIYADRGNDIVYGGQGSDEITGDDGDDILYADDPVVKSDYNNDRISDGSDFLAWQRNFGKTGLNVVGDANNDGVVNGNDLNRWKNDFGLEDKSPLEADYARDGRIDGNDFLSWQRNFGKTGTNLLGDGNSDGVVNGADLGVWKGEFGTSAVIEQSNDIVDGADFLSWQRNFGKTGTNLAADTNNDGVVNGLDLNVWKNNFGSADNIPSDDILNGGRGKDILYAGYGKDTLTGGADADIFILTAVPHSSNFTTIKDFTLSTSNPSLSDKLDFSDILEQYDPARDLISNFLRLTDDGTKSILSIDQNGGADNFIPVAELTGVTQIATGAVATQAELQILVSNGTFIV